MLRKLRDSIYLGDDKAYDTLQQLCDIGITSVVIVADDMPVKFNEANQSPRFVKIGLRSDRLNPPHIKDLACHTAKYMVQCGEIVLIQSVTGLQRGAFVAARVIVELENGMLHQVMNEIKKLEPSLDLGKSYF